MTDPFAQFQQGYAPQQAPAPQGYPPPPQYQQQPTGAAVWPPMPAGYPYPEGAYHAPPQAPQGYPGYPPVQPAPAPAVQGSLDDFFGQRSSGGGASLKFTAIGQSYTGMVTRAIGPGDVQQQTNIQGVPQTFRDGSPKWVMTVPLTLPDGSEATWYVKGQDRDALVAAMEAAGAPTGPPEKSAVVTITYVRDKANGAGFNPTKIKEVTYDRRYVTAPTPGGTPFAGTAGDEAQATAAPSAPGPIARMPQDASQRSDALYAQVPAPVQPAPAPVQPQPAPAPAGVPADQAAVFAQLLGS